MFETIFINRCLKNLLSTKLFYKYYKEEKTYKDLYNFYIKFLSIIHKSRLKIVTFSDKSFDMYASIVSIFLSNNVWIPLSNNNPVDRLLNIFDSLKPDIIILDKESALLKSKKLFLFLKKKNIKIIFYNEINNSKLSSKKIVKQNFDYKNISMIFFTSGSTGDPKGVCITYRSFIKCFEYQNNVLYKNKRNYIFADYHDPSFVISLVILFPCIYLGSTISPSINLIETLNPINHLNKNRINCLITVPSTIQRMIAYMSKKNFSKKIKVLVMCGEPFKLSLEKLIFKYIKPKLLYNFYGSTEVSPWIFSYKCKKTDINRFSQCGFVPVGDPLGDTKIKIKDKELLVTGSVLSKGYLLKEQNKNIFIKHGSRIWYSTKDQIFLFKKNYFIKGRIDKVVKIKGFRVDLTDIEASLRKIRQINDAIVFLKKEQESESISCAVTLKKKVSKQYIYESISKLIPPYMVPNRIKIYKKFPLNRSGKIDRNKITTRY